jgi:hypothetical protein
MELKENWLESRLAAEKNLPLVVIDYKVYAHAIHSFTESALDIVGEDNEPALRNVVKALWAYKLNRGIDSIPRHDFTAVVVDDFKGEFGDGLKGYWRSIEAHALGMPEYKGSRPDKPSLFPIILEEGYKYLKAPGSTFHFFEKEFYEADDVAGKIARIQRNSPPIDRYILLSTLDGDWQGLVSDQHKIVWCNSGPWLPRIRTEYEVCDYYLRKEKLHIKTARETYTVKVEVGDKGDNLMPGTPLRFFDLYEEDEVWGWTADEEATLTGIMADTRQSNRPDHLAKAEAYLKGLGMFLPEIPAPDRHEIALFSERAVKERREALYPNLKGLNKKHCIDLPDGLFEKCAKIVEEDKAALDEIKELESLRKWAGPEAIDSQRIKKLKQARKDYKTMLIRFNAK